MRRPVVPTEHDDRPAVERASRRAGQGARGIAFWLAVIWLVCLVFGAVLVRLLPLPDPNAVVPTVRLESPLSSGHLFGTDGLGRDLLARALVGARVSLTISATAALVGGVIGTLLGMIAGYRRGWVDALIGAGVDILLAFPGLVLLLALVAVFGQRLLIIAATIAFLSIPFYTRVARATTLSVVQREYVVAARAIGAKPRRIVLREVLPNVVPPMAAFALIALGSVVVLESTLAFLGLSVQPPNATWGTMIAEGKLYLATSPYPVLVPCLMLFVTVLSLNTVGDRLSGRLDTREAKL